MKMITENFKNTVASQNWSGVKLTSGKVRSTSPFNWCFWLILSMTIVILSVNVTAAETLSQTKTHEIYLTHHDFEAWTFQPQPNDRIDIINKSDIAHSIYITSPDGTITNLDVQLPGATVSWVLPESGEYLLRCWIHPIILAKLSVNASTNLSSR